MSGNSLETMQEETVPSPAPAAPVIDPEMPAPLSMGAVLRIAAMRRIWFAQLISIFGDFLVLFAAISVLTFKLHATPAQITGVQIAYLLPFAVLGIIAGVFVDRWPVKPTLVSSDAIRAVVVLPLLLSHEIWHFYAVLGAVSIVSSFFAPAQGIAIRNSVPLHGLRSANALMQQAMFGMRIIGPAIAAFLVGRFGPTSCYLADSASFIGSALLIASVALPLTLATPAAPAAPGTPPLSPLGRVWADMKQGIRFIGHTPALPFVILAFAAGMFVVGCFGPLIAVYVRDILHGSTQFFGVASALIGVGMLVGINALTVIAKTAKNTTLVYTGLAGIALGLALLAGLAHPWSTLAGTFVIGFAVAGIVIPSQVMIQQETPPPLLGRVGSTTMSLVLTAQVSGLLLSGFLAATLGVRNVFAGCAVLLLLFIAAGGLWMAPRTVPSPA